MMDESVTVHSNTALRDMVPGVCPACCSPGVTLYMQGQGDESRKVQRPFRFFLCHECHLRFQVVVPDEARSLYADVQDVAERLKPAPRKEPRIEKEVIGAMRGLSNGKRVLDIGSGDGWFLAAASQAGYECTGTDVSERLAATARGRSGASVFVGELFSLGLPLESFDIVNLDVVLMYVADPRAMMASVAGLLRTGGICRIREYDADSLISRLHGKKYWMYAPTHVNVWTRRSICELARAAGLKVRRIYPGSEMSLTNWLATRPRPSYLSRAIDIMTFFLRRRRIFGFQAAADTAYYLQKP